MKPIIIRTMVLAATGLVGATLVARAQHSHNVEHHAAEASKLTTPSSIREEHAEIHQRLERLTESSGDVGDAAREVARLLHGHFGDEERLAMPLLGLLDPLAKHEQIAEADAAIAMARELRDKLPVMLEEHLLIKTALGVLAFVAAKDGDHEATEFVKTLTLHARNEEEVLYPAALLVGDMLEMIGAQVISE